MYSQRQVYKKYSTKLFPYFSGLQGSLYAFLGEIVVRKTAGEFPVLNVKICQICTPQGSAAH